MNSSKLFTSWSWNLVEDLGFHNFGYTSLKAHLSLWHWCCSNADGDYWCNMINYSRAENVALQSKTKYSLNSSGVKHTGLRCLFWENVTVFMIYSSTYGPKAVVWWTINVLRFSFNVHLLVFVKTGRFNA